MQPNVRACASEHAPWRNWFVAWFLTFASAIPVESHRLHFLEFRQVSLCQFLCLIHYLSMLPVRRVKIITNLCTRTNPITYLSARTVNFITNLCARTCMHVRRCIPPARTPKKIKLRACTQPVNIPVRPCSKVRQAFYHHFRLLCLPHGHRSCEKVKKYQTICCQNCLIHPFPPWLLDDLWHHVCFQHKTIRKVGYEMQIIRFDVNTWPKHWT